MSARKILLFPNIQVSSCQTHARLSLPPEAVTFRRNGIEFFSDYPMEPWTEMGLELESPDGRLIEARAVVVSSSGNPLDGYSVSLLFTHLSHDSQAVLGSLLVS